MSQSILDTLRDTPLSQLTPSQMESAVQLAQNILRADYYADVRGIADDIVQAIKDGEVTNRDDLEERLHETIDGTQRVIYTYQAKCGLLASDNEDAYEDETGEQDATPEVRMYYALMADVREDLDARHDIGSDWDGPKPDDEDEPSTAAALRDQ